MLSKYHIDTLWKLRLLPNFIEFNKDDTVMDAGCGDGYIGSQISSSAKKVVGVDWDVERIMRNREGYDLENLEFLNVHLGNLSTGVDSKELSGLSFTKIVNLSALEHMEFPQQVISNFSKLLKKNGELLILVPLGPGNDCRITRELVLDAVKRNMTIKETMTIRATVSLARLRRFIIFFQGLFGYTPEPEQNRFSENISHSLERNLPLVLRFYVLFVYLVIKPILYANGKRPFIIDERLKGLEDPDFMQRPILIVKAVRD